MDQAMTLSLREVRMIVDRILLQTDIVPGSKLAVRDAIVAAEAMGQPALRELHAQFARIRTADLSRIRMVESACAESFLLLDAGGEHAWTVAVPALELGVAAARRHGVAVVTVRNVDAPEMLSGIVALAGAHGVDLKLVSGRGSPVVSGRGGTGEPVTVGIDGKPAEAGTGFAVLTLTDIRGADSGRRDSADDPVMRRMITDGFPTTRDLWQEIYRLSQGALTPDTVSSRRHAGTVMVDADGRIIGRPDDDDTDFSLLRQPVLTPPETASPGSI